MGPVFDMSRDEFEEAVNDALDLIPEEFASQMTNLVVLVEDDGPPEDPTLLGIFDGHNLVERYSTWGEPLLPARITIFRNPTLAICETRDDVVEEIGITVRHELGHFFGLEEDRLHELGWG